MYYERIKVIFRQVDPYHKTGEATKGGMGLQNLPHQTFSDQLFTRVRVLYYQYLVTNHSQGILKSKIISILIIIFFFFFYLIC